MKTRRVAALVVMALMAAMVAQPAMAGVGGCRSGNCVAGAPSLLLTPTVSIVDLLGGAISARTSAYLKAMLETKVEQAPVVPGTITVQGVGGCRKGVGGC